MRRHPLSSVTLLALLLPRVAAACTPALGVDVAAFHAAVERPPYALWAVSAAAALLWLLSRWPRRCARRWTVGLLGLAVLQPAWWFPGTIGDCGALRDAAAAVVAATSVALLVLALWRARREVIQEQVAGV